jgi:hypothetical protein
MMDPHAQRAQRKKLVLRVGLDVLLLLVSIVAPWWLTLILAVLLLMRYAAYEVVFVGFVMDALYTPGTLPVVLGDFLFAPILLVLASLRLIAARHMAVKL